MRKSPGIRWINLPGYKFYQEYRKCNKEACSECGEGEGHGPYWFRRDTATGKRKYIGRELPQEVWDAHYCYQNQAERLAQEHRRYLDIANALLKVRNRYKLSAREAELVREAGFIGVVYEPEDA